MEFFIFVQTRKTKRKTLLIFICIGTILPRQITTFCMSILVAHPSPAVASKEKSQLKPIHSPESQVVIHIHHYACYPGCVPGKACSIMVDPKVYLQPHHYTNRCRLVKAMNIKLVPGSNKVTQEITRFTLVFTGLPQYAAGFDFIEPGPGGWRGLNIPRNETDVYSLKIHLRNISILG